MKKYDTLVLNKAWAPVHIIGWQKAMGLICSEKVHSLDRDLTVYHFKDWLDYSLHNAETYYKVHSPTTAVAIPEIIVSVTFNRLPGRCVKYSRQNVFSRDKFRCGYCGRGFKAKELTIDHIIPRSQGGLTTWDNVVACCFDCNQKKADRTPAKANMALKFKPHKPKWESPLDNVTKHHPCKSWQHFMRRIDTNIANGT